METLSVIRLRFLSHSEAPAESLCAAVGSLTSGLRHNACWDRGNHGDVWFLLDNVRLSLQTQREREEEKLHHSSLQMVWGNINFRQTLENICFTV